MPANCDLTDHLLLAMPGLMDPNFNQTLSYICSHDEHGAMALVLNRPTELSLSGLLSQLNMTAKWDLSQPVLAGGPVEPERGFILHDGDASQWQSSLPVSASTSLTVSLDILAAIAAGEGPTNFHLALGYAGWSAGQLEAELAANAWLTIPADDTIVFSTAYEEMARVAASKLGFDLATLSGSAGHA